ncbi:serine hydrolase [Mycobacterium sp. UM_CSW]|uniref:serine hydrolase n=1 Tax=Mycobacterium sp. UM_CSW TaxID=1370119 RepID=UPI00126971AD|nr:serine hydrolase [Mycobacterium sp. UM_CSW]
MPPLLPDRIEGLEVLQRSIDDVMGTSANIDWSVCIRDTAGHELASRNADRPMKTASVGKLLLLVEVARQCARGELSGATLLDRDPELLVADSGIWQHLLIERLPTRDLCVLIASVSDNLATNILLKRVGLRKLRDLAESLDLVHTALLDYVRDHRGPDDPATLSTGSASELSRLMSQLGRKELISQTVSEQVNAWLATSVDLSMVAGAFGLDPLAHATSDRNFFVRNKTGADAGIRADVGTIGRVSVWFDYAVIANWDPSDRDLRDEVLAGMHAIGMTLRTMIESAS